MTAMVRLAGLRHVALASTTGVTQRRLALLHFWIRCSAKMSQGVSARGDCRMAKVAEHLPARLPPRQVLFVVNGKLMIAFQRIMPQV